ncbi:TPA: hypothetical protein ACF311_003111 [Vibrio parahaemolyticus]|uniref:hypothetical protein n=1 Tax=Vibrio parahaemolyticus TaxID=670 RepID=UPI0038493954|nr:hypothetical protein [Vibrio parahaemolyticus]
MTEETKHETSTTEISSLDIAKPVQMTDSIIGQCMVEFDVCPLRAPITYNNKVYDCMVREREAVIRDRIHAEQWSIGEFDSVYIDAVRAFFIADTCRFGVLDMKTIQEDNFIRVTKAVLTESAQLPVDCIVDSLAVKDYANVSHMLGKA